MSPFLSLSGVELADLIRRREARSVDVVRAHVEHARRVNPEVNAIVADRYADALEEARAADAAIEARRDVPLYHGVPCSIKECFSLTGMPNTAGHVARVSLRASEDATGVRRIREAGAIPIGVTNTSELCMWMESDNRVYGRTNNPYDPSRIVGGSSGGEGAIIGAGASPFGLGSDIGGSIRMPAFFNGVFGHKPTGGLIPNSGQYPLPDPGPADRYATSGPLCRRAADLAPLVGLLAGPDGLDAGCRSDLSFGDPEKVDVRKLRVLVVPDDGRTPVDHELREAQRRAAAHLRRLGADVIETRIEELRHTIEIWAAMLQEATQTPFEMVLNDGKPMQLGSELLRWAARRSPHTIPSLALVAVERVAQTMPGRKARAIEIGKALRKRLDDALGEDGVMLYPSYTSPAPRHYMPLVHMVRWVYTAILNVMELPSTQVPLGLGPRGLPLGVQVVSAHGADHRSIAVALELERAFGGWVFPARLAR